MWRRTIGGVEAAAPPTALNQRKSVGAARHRRRPDHSRHIHPQTQGSKLSYETFGVFGPFGDVMSASDALMPFLTLTTNLTIVLNWEHGPQFEIIAGADSGRHAHPSLLIG